MNEHIRGAANGAITTAEDVRHARHARVAAAVGTIMGEVDRLRALQKYDEDRRLARAETAEITELALRKAAVRAAKKHLMITVDKKLFWDIASFALSKLNGQAYAELERELTAIDDRDKRLSGGG
jgi:hypothetical protein